MKKIISCSLFILSSYFGVAQNIVREHLDINDIKAGFLAQGDMFWDPATGLPDFEYPKGSGKHCNFGNVLWIGGKNSSNGILHMAAQGWRTRGSEYWPGPLNTMGEINNATSKNWDQIWKINRTTIDSFLQIEKHTEANTAKSILQWPAQGNVRCKTPTGKKLIIPNKKMAPFIDVNNDGIYNPLQGDYPDIKGEQMLWWVMNDKLEAHLLSQAPAMGIEIHASAFACNNIAFKNVVFLNLEITNNSENLYDSTIVSLSSEGDLGMAYDDFLGFDSTRRMGILYNGDGYDEGFSNYGYNIPQMGTLLMHSPQDNDYHKEAVGAFTFFGNGVGATGDPSNAEERYLYMTGRWKDGYPFVEGCSPRGFNTPATPYVFPGDPQDKTTLSEPTCNNAPSNRRFVMSTQPFILKSQATIKVSYAFLATNMSGNSWDFSKIRLRADQLILNSSECSNFKSEPITDSNIVTKLAIYPNPANDHFTIEDLTGAYKKVKLFTPLGQRILEKRTRDEKIEINTANLRKGIYFLKLEMNDQVFSKSILIN